MAPIFCDSYGVAEGCDLVDELAQVHTLLERYTLKRYDLKRKINRFHSPIIRQLPPDVMSTIFEFCLPDFVDLQSSPASSNVDLCVPLSPGAICSYWREIAIASNLTKPTSPTIMRAPIFRDRCGDTVADECDPLDELSQLDALLGRLRLKLCDLKRKTNRFHCPIIHQLPPDVTSTIFEFCLPDFANFQHSPPSLSTVDLCIPLSLGAICSYWREIAWSTPCLWSSLVVYVKPSKRDSHTAIVQEWLARSGQLPLSIRIFSNGPATKASCHAVRALANIINQYSTRWSDFDLCMPQSFCQFFHATDNHAPILESIRFHFVDKCDAGNFQLTCPRLERANLSRFRIEGTNIQWDNLTHLNLHIMSIIDAFFILRKASRLVFCEISNVLLYQMGAPIIPLILTSLRSLRITSNSDKLLNSLITPRLEELNVLRYYNQSMEVIGSFLKRSACSLRSFSTILNIPAYFENFMRILPLLPSLKTLSITSEYCFHFDEQRYDPRSILQLLAKVLSSQSTTLQTGLLPNLEVLEYTGELHLRPGNYADLYPLPPADNALHGRLHLLKLDISPITRIPKNAISYFLSLAERGIMVNVLSKSEDILQSSIEHFRDREESLCRDWFDNFDSSLWCISN